METACALAITSSVIAVIEQSSPQRIHFKIVPPECAFDGDLPEGGVGHDARIPSRLTKAVVYMIESFVIGLVSSAVPGTSTVVEPPVAGVVVVLYRLIVGPSEAAV